MRPQPYKATIVAPATPAVSAEPGQTATMYFFPSGREAGAEAVYRRTFGCSPLAADRPAGHRPVPLSRPIPSAVLYPSPRLFGTVGGCHLRAHCLDDTFQVFWRGELDDDLAFVPAHLYFDAGFEGVGQAVGQAEQAG